MKRRLIRDNGEERRDTRAAGRCRALKSMRRVVAASLFAVFLLASVLFPGNANSLTLDEAVTAQLEIVEVNFVFKECGLLLGSDVAANKLVGGLFNICDRGLPAGASSTPETSGGGAGTPTALPGIVKERMEVEEEAGEDSAVMKLGRRLNLFVSAEYDGLNRKVTAFEDSYRSDILRLTAGVDLQITERSVAGIALDTFRHDGVYGGGGGFKNDSYGIILFGSYLPTDKAFMQAYGGYALQSNERNRTAAFTDEEEIVWPGSPAADYNADRYSVGLLVGYDHPIGGLTISPSVGLDWAFTDYGTYSETEGSGLGLTFHDDEETMLQSSVGLSSSVAASTDFGVVVAQQSVYYKHEFKQDQRDVEVSFVEDNLARRFTYQTKKPDRNFFEFNAGLVFVLPRGIQAFVNFRTLFSHKFLDSHAETIGFRYEL